MARLCAAGVQLREQIDDDYPDRDRKSDGWIADARQNFVLPGATFQSLIGLKINWNKNTN